MNQAARKWEGGTEKLFWRMRMKSNILLRFKVEHFFTEKFLSTIKFNSIRVYLHPLLSVWDDSFVEMKIIFPWLLLCGEKSKILVGCSLLLISLLCLICFCFFVVSMKFRWFLILLIYLMSPTQIKILRWRLFFVEN